MFLARKFLLILVTFYSFSVLAYSHFNHGLSSSSQASDYSATLASDDSDLIEDVSSKKNSNFVSAANLVVTQLLADQHSDSSGLTHQRWVAKMSNGANVLIIYNLDMGDHVPVHVGDSFDVAGQFIWSDRGYGLVHWTHLDPEHKRPNGYVHYNGVFYGLSQNSN